MSLAAGPSRPVRETVLAAAFFLAVTVLMTWPQAAHLSDGLTDIWDAKLNARILQWDFRQTFRDPVDLFQLDFFHPARYVLAFSENLWGVSLFGWPLLAAGASPLTNYNVLLLLGMFLSAVGAWALARYVTGDALAAVAAGIVFAFLPWRFSQMSHVQHQWGGFLALLMLFLLRYLEEGRRRDQVLFATCFAWNALSNVHYAVFSGILVAAVLCVHAVERGRDGRGRTVGALLAAAAGGLAFLPFALPYRRAEALYGMKRYFGEMMTYSGRWTYFLSAGDKNRLWGPWTTAWRGPEGDFFPGVTALALAIVALLAARRPRPVEERPAPLSPSRRRAARVIDALIAVAAAAWLAAHLRPALRVGPVSIGDAGRPLVWVTAFLFVRLVLAFPVRARYANLGDWLRRGPFPSRLVLLAALAAVGVVVAFGGHTPYYRFLFQAFGGVFRAIRAPSRGIVLFDLALAVLAAWGLSFLLRHRSAGRRLGWTAAAVAALGTEYRAFPLEIRRVEAGAPPVYRWLATLDLPSAVVEWPFGLLYDFDYVFRQAQHEKPLLNGYSGFFPKAYQELEAELKKRPIPDTVWARMGELGAGLLVYHAHEGRGIGVTAYADALDRMLDSGGLEIVRSFPHEGGRDFVFIAAGTPWRRRVRDTAPDAASERRLYAEAISRLRASVASLEPPFASLDAPAEGAAVEPGAWAFGWALDDSGIADVRIATEAGPVGSVSHHLRREGLGSVFPDYPDAEHGGFAFHVPDLAPGPHRLTLTFIASDGGRTTLTRSFRVLPRPRGSPRPGDATPPGGPGP